MKSKDVQIFMVILVAAILVTGSIAFFAFNGGSASTVVVDPDTGEPISPWANKIIKHNLVVKDKFAGTDVAVTALVYDEEPADWNNPRGTFDDASEYTAYTASSGVVTIDQEYPGSYFVVMTATGYNTEFAEIEITNGVGFDGTSSDYNAEPDSEPITLALVGSTTDVDFAVTLVNDSSAEVEEIVNLKLADDTEFRGWKVIVNDEEKFSIDYDGDGVYDEGISKYVVIVNDERHVIFDVSKSIDEFDSNDEYTFYIEGVTVADGSRLSIEVEIDAITGDYTGANDGVWGEGEGVLSSIKIYDLLGTPLFATVDVTA